MRNMNGTNNFGARFDFFKWSAPIYEAPQEVVLAVDDLHLKGKTVKCISAIGSARNIGNTDTGLLYRRLDQAGVDLNTAKHKEHPNADKVLLPCEAEFFEPFQIIFADGTTLDILPMENGSVRIARNTIPVDLTTGINKRNLDAQKMFGDELTGQTFEELSVKVCKVSETCYSPHSVKRSASYERVSTQYHYQLIFSNAYRLEIDKKDYQNGYCLKLCKYNQELEVPYARIRSATEQTQQIELLPGHKSGGYIWVTPVRNGADRDNGWLNTRYANWALSMDDVLCREFLGIILQRHFDPSIQKRNAYEDQTFDWYGTNSYRFETMEKLLTDVRHVAKLLGADYDAPELDEIKKQYHSYTFGDENMDVRLSDEEQAALIRNNIHIAIDFYERFTESVEAIMRASEDCDRIIFSGP